MRRDDELNFEQKWLGELTSEEKAGGWNMIASHMESTRAVSTFFADAALETLSSNEKNEIRASLRTYRMDDTEMRAFFAPATAVQLSKSEKKTLKKDILQQASQGQQSPKPWYEELVEGIGAALRFGWSLPAMLLLLVATTLGASYASADSLPGDFLYPIKRAGESILAGLQMSSESRAEGEARRMDLRVREAEKLAQRAKFTDDARLSIDEEFKRERRDALKHIQELESQGKQQAVSRLRARLQAVEDHYDRVINGERREPEQRKPARSFPTIQKETRIESPTILQRRARRVSASSALTSISSVSASDGSSSSAVSSAQSSDTTVRTRNLQNRIRERALLRVEKRTEHSLNELVP